MKIMMWQTNDISYFSKISRIVLMMDEGFRSTVSIECGKGLVASPFDILPTLQLLPHISLQCSIAKFGEKGTFAGFLLSYLAIIELIL